MTYLLIQTNCGHFLFLQDDSLQISFEDALSILEAESKGPVIDTQSLPADDKKFQNEIDNLVENMSGVGNHQYIYYTLTKYFILLSKPNP